MPTRGLEVDNEVENFGEICLSTFRWNFCTVRVGQPRGLLEIIAVLSIVHYLLGYRENPESIDERSIDESFSMVLANSRRSTYPWIEIDVPEDPRSRGSFPWKQDWIVQQCESRRWIRSKWVLKWGLSEVNLPEISLKWISNHYQEWNCRGIGFSIPKKERSPIKSAKSVSSPAPDSCIIICIAFVLPNYCMC